MNFTFESPQTNDVTNGIPAGFKRWIRSNVLVSRVYSYLRIIYDNLWQDKERFPGKTKYANHKKKGLYVIIDIINIKA